MSNIVNKRDLILQNAPQRLLPSSGAAVILSSTAPMFHESNEGVVTPSSIIVTAQLLGMDDNAGVVTFTASGAALSGINGNTAVLMPTGMSGTSATITATINYRGIQYSSNITLSKVTDGVSGVSGVSGDSSAIAYVLVDGNSLAAAPATYEANAKAMPPSDVWGNTRAFVAHPPVPAAGQSVFQTNGIYNVAADKTVWSVPYLSSLRVGSLSALTVNTGDLNISGNISSSNGKFSVDANGNLTVRAISVENEDGTVMLTSGGGLTEAAAAPGTLNSDLTGAIQGAQSSADAANQAIADIFSDGIISPSEKPELNKQWNTIYNEHGGIYNQATTMGLITQRDNYYGTVTSLSSLINALGTQFSTIPGESIIANGAALRVAFENHYIAKQALLTSIAAKAATQSEWVGVSGAGKPQDNANFTTPSKGSAINDDPALENVANTWILESGISYAEGTSVPGAVGKGFLTTAYSPQPNSVATTKAFHTVDANCTYSLTAALYASAGNDRQMYIFVDFYDPSGNALSTSWGSARSGYVYGGVPTEGNFTRYGADFGVGTDRPIPAAARTMKVGVWFQYSGTGSGTVEQAAQDIRLTEVTAVAAAQGRLEAISSDNMLSMGEKPQVITDWGVIVEEVNPLLAQADSLGVDRGAYLNAYTLLSNYLPVDWNNVAVDTPINGAEFRSNFTAYYTTKQALLNAIAAKAATQANTDGSIRTPGGGYRTTTNSVETGSLKVSLPQSWTNTMIKFTVDIYEYVTGYSCTLEVSGYNSSNPGWYNVAANVVGGNKEYPVRFGHDGTKCCVWIGEAGETWAYPQVRVRDVLVGYSATAASLWGNGWQISFDSGGPINISGEILDTYPGADWSKIPSKGGRPSDNASSDVSLVARNATVVGNTAKKTGGNHGLYDADVYSRDSYVGGAFVSASPMQLDGYLMFGLNTDPTTDSNYASIDWAIYPYGDGTGSILIYESGVDRGVVGTYSVGDVLAVVYDGSYVRYLKNGEVLRSVAATITAPLFFDSTFHSTGSGISNIRFGPLSSNGWGSIGGAGKPQDNATVGAPNGTYVGGTLAETVAANAAAGVAAQAALSGKLNKNADDVLGGVLAVNTTSTPVGLRVGSLLWNAAGDYTSGSGVAITPKGIVGHNGTKYTFTINASTGDAVFGGSLNAASGTFGNVTVAQGGNLSAGGGRFNVDADGKLTLLSAVGATSGLVLDNDRIDVKVNGNPRVRIGLL